jgi:Uma2 family endonuclease
MTPALADMPEDAWTTFDLDDMPEDGRRRELIDGVLHMPPTPSAHHQTLAMLLGARLHASCPRDFRVTQAVEVRLTTLRCLIPDVLVVTPVARRKFMNIYHAQEVVLAVEIVSPTSLIVDRVTTPPLCAEAGIPHFWRVEDRRRRHRAHPPA